MIIILFFVDLVAFIVSVVWCINTQEYASVVSVVGTFAALLGLIRHIFIKKQATGKQVVKKIQKAGKNSKQYMSDGDMTINER